MVPVLMIIVIQRHNMKMHLVKYKPGILRF